MAISSDGRVWYDDYCAACWAASTADRQLTEWACRRWQLLPYAMTVDDRNGFGRRDRPQRIGWLASTRTARVFRRRRSRRAAGSPVRNMVYHAEADDLVRHRANTIDGAAPLTAQSSAPEAGAVLCGSAFIRYQEPSAS